ncbi:MAG: membrane protein insertion efficiency factor YidD [Spirochaetales bacterium]|nr:membrane protein insertion efficiency factor YidD [Spirochaetales bacterium]
MDIKAFIRNIYLIPVFIYKGVFSPMMGPMKCRYTPSCSSYFIQAVRKHGIIKGTILGLSRILRCRPGFLGGPDEVPEVFTVKGIRDSYRIYRKPRGSWRESGRD